MNAEVSVIYKKSQSLIEETTVPWCYHWARSSAAARCTGTSRRSSRQAARRVARKSRSRMVTRRRRMERDNSDLKIEGFAQFPLILLVSFLCQNRLKRDTDCCQSQSDFFNGLRSKEKLNCLRAGSISHNQQVKHTRSTVAMTRAAHANLAVQRPRDGGEVAILKIIIYLIITN